MARASSRGDLHVHPPVSWPRRGLVLRPLEVMRIVHGNAVEQLAARQDAIPDFLEPGHAAAAEVVHGRMAVEDLEQPRALHLRRVVGGDRPAEIRMVDARHAAARRGSRRPCLCTMSTTELPPGGLMNESRRKAVDVNRLVAEPIGDFLALDDEELVVGAVQRVEAVHAGQVVVIGERDEVVAVLAIPADDIVRRRVAVAVERVRVQVAFEP